MRHVILLFALTLAALTSAPALETGDKAPSLAAVTWVKQGPVDVGRSLTVVEFWATWCGPCRVSIPKLTALAAAHKDRLVVVGLSDEDAATVKPFVTAQDTKMDYNVGLADEALHESYMAGRDGIPYAFLVGADGVVMWHGHPLALEKVITAVLSGTWDAKAEAVRAARSQELQAMLQTDPAGDEAGLMKQILKKTGEILTDDPTDPEALNLRLGVAKHLGDRALVRSTLEAIPLDHLDADSAADFALRLAHDEEPADRHLDLAYAFAERAVTIDGDSAAAHAALAAVQHALGLVDKAVANQELAAAADPKDANTAATLAFYRETQRLAALLLAGKPLTPPAAPVAPQHEKAGTNAAPKADSPAGPAGLVP